MSKQPTEKDDRLTAVPRKKGCSLRPTLLKILPKPGEKFYAYELVKKLVSEQDMGDRRKFNTTYVTLVNLLREFEKEGIIKFVGWKESRGLIKRKVYMVSFKTDKQQPKYDATKERELMLGYQLNPNISFELMGSVIQENRMNMRDENPYIEFI